MPGEIHLGEKKWQKKLTDLSNQATLSPEMASILSNSEGWGPTKVAYIKKCRTGDLDHSMHYNLSEEQLESFFFHPSLQNMRQNIVSMKN